MAITITDNGTTIRLDYGSGVIEDIAKSDISNMQPIEIPDVTGEWTDRQYVAIITTAGITYKVHWADVTTPVVVSNADLYNQLFAFWQAGAQNQVFVATALYDFAVHGGAISTIGLGVYIPNTAIVKMSYMDVLTEIDSVLHGGTFAIGYLGTTDAFLAPTGDPIAVGFVAGKQDGTVPNFHTLTATREVAVTIGAEAMTQGKATIILEYVVPA